MKNKNKNISAALFIHFKHLYNVYKERDLEREHHQNEYGNTDFYGIDFEDEFTVYPLQDSILKEIDKIYNQGNIYFFDCSFEVYSNKFNERQDKYFKKNIDAKELDFLKSEFNYFSNPKENRFFKGGKYRFYYNDYFNYEEKYKLSLDRKIEYLSEKLKQFSFKIEMSEPESIYDSMYNIETFIEPSPVLVPIQKKDTEIKNEKNQIENEISNSNKKIDTDISVPQLSLLFKMINDLKPSIFKTNSKEELFAFISNNFKTKKSSESGISTNKLRNEFSKPDLKAIEFWEKHLHTMLTEIRKSK